MSSPKSVSPEKAEFNLRGYKHFVDQRNRRKQAHSGSFLEPGTSLALRNIIQQDSLMKESTHG